MARPRRRSGNLPAEATSFVGRRRELAGLRKKLSAARLISLVGPGGVGKTRLALRVAADLGRGFPNGAWFVQLADVRDEGLVVDAAIAALDLRDQAAAKPLEMLVSYLRDKQLLLVLDNCEHLLGAAARLVVAILSSAPNVRVIITSREPLQAPGENVFAVPPLELPSGDGEEPLSQVRQNEAVALFIERAAAASGSFQLTDSNWPVLVDLCRRLDGLPLALELAAVRTRVLSAEQILDRLTNRFALLTGGSRAGLPRHQTLQTTIDWSHDLLTTEEQTLFRRLCVFAGRFTLEDIERVCAYEAVRETEVLDLLSSLVDKSLVTRGDVRRRACYRLHETMREYASLKLREAETEDLLQERCLQYYRTRCVDSADKARYRMLEWLDWVELEIDNIRSVLQRCLASGDPQRGLDIAASMSYYWITRGTNESIRWLDALLASAATSPHAHVRAYHLRGWLSMMQADPSAARPWLVRAIATARETGPATQLSESLSMASTAESMAGDLAAAKGLLSEAEAMTAHIDDFPARIALLQARTINAIFQGDLATASVAASEGVRLSREAGDLYMLEMMLLNRGVVALMGGDLETSKPNLTEALRIAGQIDDRIAQYYCLDTLSRHAASSGQGRLAARLAGAAATIGGEAGANIIRPTTAMPAGVEELTIGVLGVSAFEAAFEAGQHLDREQALRLALGESERAVVASDGAEAGPLAKREVEVARLVAEGLTNKQIGARLFISERTAGTHVRNILNKLGFSSRAQIASWMASSKS